VKVIDKGRIVQIDWVAADLADKAVLTQIYSALIKALENYHFVVLSSSVAIDGTVILGNPMSHPKEGISFWMSLLHRERKIRVDMDYELKSDHTPCRWKITISADAFIPEYNKELAPQGD
jgi:hypothetical protein